MIDANDKSTVDLFPVKRGRGRPVTGNAKTSAERQASYRNRVKKIGSMTDFGKLNINTWIDTRAKFALERLARRSGLSESAMLERLLLQADESVYRGLPEEERGSYYDVE